MEICDRARPQPVKRTPVLEPYRPQPVNQYRVAEILLRTFVFVIFMFRENFQKTL